MRLQMPDPVTPPDLPGLPPVEEPPDLDPPPADIPPEDDPDPPTPLRTSGTGAREGTR